MAISLAMDVRVGTVLSAEVNFPPKQIGRFMSEVLVLGLSDAEGRIVLIGPDQPVPTAAACINLDRVLRPWRLGTCHAGDLVNGCTGEVGPTRFKPLHDPLPEYEWSRFVRRLRLPSTRLKQGGARRAVLRASPVDLPRHHRPRGVRQPP